MEPDDEILGGGSVDLHGYCRFPTPFWRDPAGLARSGVDSSFAALHPRTVDGFRRISMAPLLLQASAVPI